MTFRNYKGNDWSENGWRICDRNECERIFVPGADNTFLAAMIVRSGASEVVLRAWAIWYHRNVEPLDRYKSGVGDDWGWSRDNDVDDSNHLSGTALDFNAVQYPMGQRRMSADRVATINEGLRLFEDNIFHGRKWNYPDEMHFQLGAGTASGTGPSAKLSAFARRLNEGYLGLLTAGTVPAPAPTPTPSASRPTLRRGNTGGDVTYLQSLFNRAYPAYSKLAVDGDFGPATEAVAREFQRRSNLAVDGIVGPATWRALGVK